jgi:hypothetical protein
MFRAYAPGLSALIIAFIGLTLLRDFRDNFAAEIWTGLGMGGNAEIFALSELPVAVVVLATLALLMFIRDNRRAFMANLILIGFGFVVAGAASALFQAHLIGPVTWMVTLGAGLYLSYTPFNAILFDRFIAASGRAGTAGFLMYLADSFGYAGSVVLLVVRNFMDLSLSWVDFLILLSYCVAAAGLALVVIAGVYFNRRLGETARPGPN